MKTKKQLLDEIIQATDQVKHLTKKLDKIGYNDHLDGCFDELEKAVEALDTAQAELEKIQGLLSK